MAKKNVNKYSVPDNQDEAEVLPNLLGIKTKREIDIAEFTGFFEAQEYFIETLTPETVFNLKYLYSIHKKAFGHLYSFAGKLRTVNMSKGGFVFPAARFLPEQIEEFERNILSRLSGPYDNEERFFNDLAKSHAELLYLHPFREGNGRTARLFATLIALKHYKKQLDFASVLKKEMPAYIKAVQQASIQEYSLMESLFKRLL